MSENNKIYLFVRDYSKAMNDKYLPVIEEVESKIRAFDSQSKKDGNPIISRYCHRIKDVYEVIKKAEEKGIDLTLDEAEERIHDIIGFRIVTTFLYEIYDFAKILSEFDGFKVIDVKDYIMKPKDSGYRSLHLIIEVDVKELPQPVTVEFQIRDVLMDGWCEIEHKMKYKGGGLSESLDSLFVEKAEKLNSFDEEISKYKFIERQKASQNHTTSNLAKVVAAESIIEQKPES